VARAAAADSSSEADEVLLLQPVARELRDARRAVRLHIEETLVGQPRERLAQRHEREAESAARARGR
jgi:hypothetical protein